MPLQPYYATENDGVWHVGVGGDWRVLEIKQDARDNTLILRSDDTSVSISLKAVEGLVDVLQHIINERRERMTESR